MGRSTTCWAWVAQRVPSIVWGWKLSLPGRAIGACSVQIWQWDRSVVATFAALQVVATIWHVCLGRSSWHAVVNPKSCQCACSVVCRDSNRSEVSATVWKGLFSVPFMIGAGFHLWTQNSHQISRQIHICLKIGRRFAWYLCICLKIGLGRVTFSCNHKSVRLILWKALQSGRALFRLEDYYIVYVHT